MVSRAGARGGGLLDRDNVGDEALELGLHAEVRFGHVPFGMEDVHVVGLPNGESKGGSLLVEVDCSGLRVVNAAQVDDLLVVDVHKHVIVADEGEGLAALVGEGRSVAADE